MHAVVTPSVLISSTAPAVVNSRITTFVTPAAKPWVAHQMPPMWKPAMPMRLRSSARQSIQSRPACRECVAHGEEAAVCEHDALGQPVVPLVYICTSGVSGVTLAEQVRRPAVCQPRGNPQRVGSRHHCASARGSSGASRAATAEESASANSSVVPESRRMCSTSSAASRQLIGTSTAPVLARAEQQLVVVLGLLAEVGDPVTRLDAGPVHGVRGPVARQIQLAVGDRPVRTPHRRVVRPFPRMEGHDVVHRAQVRVVGVAHAATSLT